MPQVTLAEKIRYLRKSRGMSQLDLAHRLGLRNNSFISHLERGSKRPSRALLGRIADLFSYDLDHLLALDGAPREAHHENDDDDAPRPLAGADLLADLRQEIQLFGERMDEIVEDVLPAFLWDRQHRLIVESQAREVWVLCPAIANHGVAEDLLRVTMANLERGVSYRYLLLDDKQVRIDAGSLLRRYQELPEETTDIEICFVRREHFPFVFETALFDPTDPGRSRGSMTPPGETSEWEVALTAQQTLELAAYVAPFWDAS